MSKLRQSEAVSDSEISKEIKLYLTLAKLYDKNRFDKKTPNSEILALENYRAAANLNDTNAQYIVASRFIERGKFWDRIRKSSYACEAHNQYAKDCYQEGLAYLKSAEEQGHFLAKRLHGLAYIHGWGVEKDEDGGFKLVVASIEQEGAWSRATKIFEELGLNRPEFFSSIMSLREGRD